MSKQLFIERFFPFVTINTVQQEMVFIMYKKIGTYYSAESVDRRGRWKVGNIIENWII